MASTAFPAVVGVLMLGSVPLLGDWLGGWGVAGLVGFTLAVTVLGGLALLPTYTQSILGGWAFGVPWGVPACIAATVAAAGMNYLLVRPCAGDRAVNLIEEHPKALAVYRALARGGFWRCVLVVSLVRAIPHSPSALTSVTMSSLQVPLAPFLLGTFLGLTPRVSAAVVVGAGLARQEMTTVEGWGTALLGVLALVAAVLVVGWFAKRALKTLSAPPAGD